MSNLSYADKIDGYMHESIQFLMILFSYIMAHNIICLHKLIKVGWNSNLISSRLIFLLTLAIEKSNTCIIHELYLYFKTFLSIIKKFVAIRINKNLNKFGNMLKLFKNRPGFWQWYLRSSVATAPPVPDVR